MTPAKKKPDVKSQAARFLEVAKKKAGVNEGGSKFAQAVGKATLARQARKATRIG